MYFKICSFLFVNFSERELSLTVERLSTELQQKEDVIKKLNDRISTLEEDRDRDEGQIADLKRQLEEEKVTRQELIGRISSLEEQQNRQTDKYDAELSEMKEQINSLVLYSENMNSSDQAPLDGHMSTKRRRTPNATSKSKTCNAM